MILLNELSNYLEGLLSPANYNDYAPNGLQIEGKPQIKRLASAVTASLEVIEQAIAWQADALLVHHGYFWKGEDPVITGIKANRIRQLLQHELSLLAYHLPLDCHPEFGNNACLAQLLEFEITDRHHIGSTKNLIFSGRLLSPMNTVSFLEHLEKKFQRKPLHLGGTAKHIQTVAWCSGAAQDFIEQAHHLGVDAYLSGEVSERTYYQAKELGIHYFACGHHATERYGVQALAKHLSCRYNLTHLFIDINNPI